MTSRMTSARVHVRRRGWAVLAGLVVAPLVLSGLGPGATAAEAPAGGDEVMVQYQVRPAAGTSNADLVDRLTLDGYDVYGGGAGSVFVHAPASAGDALAARADLVVLAENTVVLDLDQVGPASQDAVLPARLDGGDYPTFYGGYRTMDGHLQYMADLAEAYPELVKMVDFGTTWQDQDPLRVICITANADSSCQLDPDVDKPRLLLIAQTHAREITTSELMWRTATYLIDGYKKKADATSLLEGTEIWIVNNTNPSATKFVEEGITEQGTGSTSPAWQRKTLNDEYSRHLVRDGLRQPPGGHRPQPQLRHRLGRGRHEPRPVRPDVRRAGGDVRVGDDRAGRAHGAAVP